MIEAIMYFALGFLIAAAIALTTLPAVWNRAVRLTRRRIESVVPVSLAEIQADKDQVRAEYALAMRRLEISADSLQWKTAEQAVEIGRQAVSVLSMKAEMAQKLADMQAELDQKLADMQAEMDQQLADKQAGSSDRRRKECLVTSWRRRARRCATSWRQPSRRSPTPRTRSPRPCSGWRQPTRR